MEYRADIDGLRAVAVLAVIVFHIHRALLPGGFVGVDVFFVISGFLISRNIVQELHLGRFSIVEFYRRRIKRIAPALLVVTAITLVAAGCLMLPEDVHDTARSAVFALASLANVYFWLYQDTGYFAQDSLQLPLLHLWSLGVEEQFYLLWPLALAISYQRVAKPRYVWAMTVIALGSFWLGSHLFERMPSFVYYLLPTRAGELLLGSIVAVLVTEQLVRPLARSVSIWVAAGGVALLAASLCFMDESMPFPGWSALPPTAGTALLLLAGQGGPNFVARALAWRPLIAVGLISYSAYLWHWPLLALYRYSYGEIGVGAGIVLLAITLTLAWLSYVLVEQPARRSRAGVLRVLTLQLALPGRVIGGLALLFIYPQRVGGALSGSVYGAQLAAVRAATQPAFLAPGVCQFQAITASELALDRCVSGASASGSPAAILWGDANAAHYVGMVERIATRAGFRFRNIEIGSCPPLLHDPAPFIDAPRVADCRHANQLVRAHLADYPVVILGGLWNSYDARSAEFLPQLFDSIRTLAGQHRAVVILGKAPAVRGFDRKCREKALRIPLLDCGQMLLPVAADVAAVNEKLRTFAALLPNVAYFDATAYLCPHGQCATLDSAGEPRYFDYGHLSAQGSISLGEQIVRVEGVPPAFARIATPPAQDSGK